MAEFHKSASFEPSLWNCAATAARINRRAVYSVGINIRIKHGKGGSAAGKTPRLRLRIMILRNIMQPVRNTDEKGKMCLPVTQAVDELDPAALENYPEQIYVIDEKGDIIGELSKEMLVFLSYQQNLRTFSEILGAIHDGVVVVDARGRICYANPAYTTILGVPLRRIMGRQIQNIEPDSLLNQVLQNRKTIESPKQLILSLGKYVSLRAFPIYHEGTFQGAASIFRDITELQQLNREVQQMTGIVNEYSLRLQSQEALDSLGIISRDKQLQTSIQQATVAAKTDVPILLRGESGTGKDMMAEYLHRCSSRKDKAFIVVNCAAIPESLMESELFGYEGGSFTGASKEGKKGKFELADGGTLFLDEIGDMPLMMQSKLLRILQQGELEKIGRQKNIPVDVRIIAATNQPLEQMIREKRFRQDLFFRINTVMITLPPLRERPGDILPLTNYFLQEFNKKYKKNVTFSAETYHRIRTRDWLGNVRELKSYVERSVILSDESVWDDDGRTLSPLAAPRTHGEIQEEAGTLDEQVRACERKAITAALERCGGNRTKAMQALGLSRRTFYRKCAELGIGANQERLRVPKRN